MLLAKTFVKDVLRNAEFGKRVLSVVVDEAHVVSHWGHNFRKRYGEIGIVRAILPRVTPVVALSATLNARVRKDILKKLDFSKDYINIDEGNDRPNVALIVRAMEHPIGSFRDLDFVIPKNAQTSLDIPKTMVYADSLPVSPDLVDHFEGLLPETLHEKGFVRPFNAAFSSEYRATLMQEFKDGSVRVLVCTDAAGMVSEVALS